MALTPTRSHGGSQGFKPLTSTPTTSRSERRRATIGGALVVPGAAWGHTGATAGLPAQPNDRALGSRTGGLQDQLPEQELRDALVAHVLKEAKDYPGRAKRGLPREPR
jgi:hypothetical protein